MKKLIGMSLAAFFLITAACPVEAQDNTTVLYDTIIKNKPNGKHKRKVRPYEPTPAAYGYPRNIDVFYYNTYYGYRPYYGYPYNYGYPYYGYPWHRDDYRSLNHTIYDNRRPYDERTYYRR